MVNFRRLNFKDYASNIDNDYDKDDAADELNENNFETVKNVVDDNDIVDEVAAVEDDAAIE
jgi:hypothetical protein